MKKYNVTVNGTTYEVIVEEVGSVSAPVYTAPQAPASAPTPAPAPTAAPAAQSVTGNAGSNKVNSPMPGTILDVKVAPGTQVKKGDVICVLEAMKMENDIPAPCDGVVATVNVVKGASVNSGDVLATIN